MLEPYEIYEMAIRAAKKEAEEQLRNEGVQMRKLDIIFYGMACFDPLPDKQAGYKVFFPDGLQVRKGVPVHSPGIWVRSREHAATARWPWLAWRNDFFVAEPGELKISGLARTRFNDDEFDGRVLNMRDADPDFAVKSNGDGAVMTLIVDHGTLSAHVVNRLGMIAVRWRVAVADGETVRFEFNGHHVDIPAEATQIILANASDESGTAGDASHFRLYEQIAVNTDKILAYPSQRAPEVTLLPELAIDHATFGNSPNLVASDERESIRAVRLRATLVDDDGLPCPDVVCSAVQSRVRGGG